MLYMDFCLIINGIYMALQRKKGKNVEHLLVYSIPYTYLYFYYKNISVKGILKEMQSGVINDIA